MTATATETADRILATVADLVTGVEARRFRSSLVIDLTEGTRTADDATGRAFRRLWASRLGYASTLSDAQWAALKVIAGRLGIDLKG